MGNIKRVLWVDDLPNNKSANLFTDCETKKVSTMEQAIFEISGEHLYDYDTIVLDIDFSNGLPNGPEPVLEKLSQKIYISHDLEDKKKFLIDNGGYLLFLYLLEKGYPSDQVAFLTGNPGIIGQLRRYTSQNQAQMSKEDIADAFIEKWEASGGDLDQFESLIERLPIDRKYKDSDFLFDCAEKMDSEEYDALHTLIKNVAPSMVKESIENTGDRIIFKFHDANLEAPVYFSKNNNDIVGHNYEDAERWLTDKRSQDKVTRWLLLDAADYVEDLFRNDPIGMDIQVGRLFLGTNNNDPGIRSSFRQMYFVFDGLMNIQHRGVYYQAIAAMLIPFDSKTPGGAPSVNADHIRYDEIQKMFVRFAKQARNYCAHNYFGSSISNKTVVYLIMGTISAVLSKPQRESEDGWYDNARPLIDSDHAYVPADNISKIDTLCRNLLNNGDIDVMQAHVYGIDYVDYSPWDMLRALGYNTTMNVRSEQSSSVREAYFIFTLAAYVCKWFEGLSESDIETRFGHGIRVMVELSNILVDEYTYPHAV